MNRLAPWLARGMLHRCKCEVTSDFHALSSDQVAALLAEADTYGYRKPRNANGSRGRYWHAYLVRAASKESDQ